MIRSSIVIALVIILAGALSVYQIKFRVQNLRKDIAEIERQLKQEKESVHVLKAEWAYLNTPKRLRSMTEKYLQLQPVQVSQVGFIGNKDKQLIADYDNDVETKKSASKAIVMKPILSSVKVAR